MNMKKLEMMENQKEEAVKKTDKQIIEEGKAKLKSKLDEKIALLKSQCKDAHFFDSIMDEIISLKGQYDVAPTRIFVREEDLLEEYDYGSFKISRFTTGIAYEQQGFVFFVKPICQTLYGQLDFILKCKKLDQEGTLSDGLRKLYDNRLIATMDILLTPCLCFTDESYYFDLSAYITKRREQLFEDLANRPLLPETLEDEAFMQDVAIGEKYVELMNEWFKEHEYGR